MRLKAGKGKNFEDRTDPRVREKLFMKQVNGRVLLETDSFNSSLRYGAEISAQRRQKKEEGLKDKWRKMPAAEKYRKR